MVYSTTTSVSLLAAGHKKHGMEEHYSSWLETMFSQFGHKWLCLHRGPVWKYDLDAVMEASLQGTCDLRDKSTDMDGAELDVIQSALQQSSLSLDLDEGNGTLDTLNTTLGSMCIASTDVPTCSSPNTCSWWKPLSFWREWCPTKCIFRIVQRRRSGAGITLVDSCIWSWEAGDGTGVSVCPGNGEFS